MTPAAAAAAAVCQAPEQLDTAAWSRLTTRLGSAFISSGGRRPALALLKVLLWNCTALPGGPGSGPAHLLRAPSMWTYAPQCWRNHWATGFTVTITTSSGSVEAQLNNSIRPALKHCRAETHRHYVEPLHSISAKTVKTDLFWLDEKVAFWFVFSLIIIKKQTAQLLEVTKTCFVFAHLSQICKTEQQALISSVHTAQKVLIKVIYQTQQCHISAGWNKMASDNTIYTKLFFVVAIFG